MTKTGTFIGVGVGPGDPELLTLKAARLISEAEVLAYLSNEAGSSQARHIAAQAVSIEAGTKLEIPIPMPMSLDRSAANEAYDNGAEQISKALEEGKNVVFLCEGDPLMFGSFAYLLDRLQTRFECQSVPGVSSINAAASRLVEPLALQKESFVVVSGRHSEDHILEAFTNHDNVVVMKAGRARPRVLDLLARTGRTGDARYLEYVGRDNELVERDVSKLESTAGPYFSLFIVSTRNRDRHFDG